jgi:hypothetical protein
MVLNILTDVGFGFDFGIATGAGDQVIMAQLPADELNQLFISPGRDAIALGGGNDVFENNDAGRIVFGNTGNDSLVGGVGGDTIYGGQGEDTILGGAGNDVLSGDRNFDTLTGGAGADEFIMSSSSEHIDTITDFQPGVDKLRLPDGVAFTDLQLRDSASNTEIVRNDEVLTVLNGVVASSITTNDFIGEIDEIEETEETEETPPVEVTPGFSPSTAGDLGVLSGTATVQDSLILDTIEYYRFSLDQARDVELTLSGMTSNGDLRLFLGEQQPDGSVDIGNEIESSMNPGSQDDSIARSLEPGTYFVSVDAFQGVMTNYSVTFDAT